MSSVNISIKTEAYVFLKSLKSEDSSFSDIILSFKSSKSPLDFFGVLKDKDWNAAEVRIKELRTSLSNRLNRGDADDRS